MKKITYVILLIISILTLSACESKKEVYSINFFDYMDTFINVQIYTDDENLAKDLFDDIEKVYALYHDLTTGYEPLKDDSPYLANIYSINQTLNERIKIDEPLYNILIDAEDIKALTNGYFDVSVGKIVDVWKNVILDENDEYLTIEGITIDLLPIIWSNIYLEKPMRVVHPDALDETFDEPTDSSEEVNPQFKELKQYKS